MVKDQHTSIISDGIFPLGEPTLAAFRQYYSGAAFEKVLVPYTSPTGVTVAHVTYEKGCRNDWHSHPGGQLLLALSGKGWHQERGKPAVPVLPGDVIEIQFGTRTVKVEVLELQETTKKEEAKDLFKYL